MTEMFWSVYRAGYLDILVILAIIVLLIMIRKASKYSIVNWLFSFALIFLCGFPIPMYTNKLDVAYWKATTDMDSYQMAILSFKYPLWWILAIVFLIIHLIMIKRNKKFPNKI